ncbi:MAG: hypothetical protein ABSG32_25445 [Terriglobia bacterium]|jgi:hypothetical protein
MGFFKKLFGGRNKSEPASSSKPLLGGQKHPAYNTSRNQAGETAEDIVRRLRATKEAEEGSPWQKCPSCKGHGGYGGLSEPFVSCSRCGGAGRVLSPLFHQDKPFGQVWPEASKRTAPKAQSRPPEPFESSHTVPSTAGAVFTITTKGTSCSIGCHQIQSEPFCDFMKKLGFAFGARYDYSEHNLAQQIVTFPDVKYESYESEYWKCPITYRGDHVGFATFAEDSRVDDCTIGSIEITAEQLSTEAAQKLVKDLVHAFQLLEEQLHHGGQSKY